MKSAVLRSKRTLLLFSALLALVLWYQTGASREPAVDPVRVELRTAVADAPTADNVADLKVEFTRLAVRVARLGCGPDGERLSGEPTRLLVSLTQSTVAHRFISPDSQMSRRLGPGFAGSEAALVIAVEGQVEPEFGDGARQVATSGSFVFVEPVGDPEFTTCVIRESPLSLNQSDFLYGSFDFEVFELR